MGKEKKQQAKILGLIIGLVAVLIGGLLFMGAVSGWFDDEKIVLDKEYYSEWTNVSRAFGTERIW